MNRNRSARGVAAKEGALRPSHDFNSVDIEKADVVAVLAGDVDVIDVGAHWGVERRDGFSVTQAA